MAITFNFVLLVLSVGTPAADTGLEYKTMTECMAAAAQFASDENIIYQRQKWTPEMAYVKTRFSCVPRSEFK